MSDPTAIINDLRSRIVSGDEPTRDEIAEGLRLLREQRQTALDKEAKPARKPGRQSKAMDDSALDDLFSGGGDKG